MEAVSLFSAFVLVSKVTRIYAKIKSNFALVMTSF